MIDISELDGDLRKEVLLNLSLIKYALAIMGSDADRDEKLRRYVEERVREVRDLLGATGSFEVRTPWGVVSISDTSVSIRK